MSRIQGVLFDLDGTLVDSARDFIAITQAMRSEQGLAPLNQERINGFRQVVSQGAQAMVNYGFNLAPDDAQAALLKLDFLQRYQTQFAQHSTLFTGMPEVLQFLEKMQVPWGVATNKPALFAEPLMQALHLDQRCAALLCPEHVEKSKPAPDMLYKAAEQLALSPEKIVYIGDDLRDIQAAQAADMPSIAVTYGYHAASDNPQLWGANQVVASPEALLNLLEQVICGC